MLDFADAIHEAVDHLKRIVPTLRKLQLAPNPHNYALWYVHISQRRPELSVILEKVEQGLIPYDDEVAQKLFQKHVCLHSSDLIANVVPKFHLLATTLNESLQQNIDNSTHMDNRIANSRLALQTAMSSEDIANSVGDVITQLDEFTEANRAYRVTMQQTNAEISQLRVELERAQQSANVDELTRLFNRATFYRELKYAIQQNDPSQSLCIVLCDLDYFKSINDRFGHLVGDRVLQRIGTLLLEISREGTLAARYGGEEFALILPNTNLAEATLFAERVRSAISKVRIKIRNSDTVLDNLTASFGVACLHRDDSAETLFERADKALYLAKEAGRNTTRTEVSV